VEAINDFRNKIGTLLPRANAAACPQLAKADFASLSRRVREGQRIAALDAEVDALQRQALALGAEPSANVTPWVLLAEKIGAPPRGEHWLSPWRSTHSNSFNTCDGTLLVPSASSTLRNLFRRTQIVTTIWGGAGVRLMANRQLDNPNCSACDTKMNLTVLIPPVRESIYGVYTCPNCGRSEDYLVRLPSKAA
jgi:hypothetical protein